LTAAEARVREALTVLKRLFAQVPGKRDWLLEEANLLGELGDILARQGKYVPAREALEQSLKKQSTLDTRNAAVTLQRLGLLARIQGEYAEARMYLFQALEQFQALGEPAPEADTWSNLGRVALDMKELAEAEHCLGKSLELYERLTNVAGAAKCCKLFADVAARAGRPADAENWLQGALRRIKLVEPGGVIHANYLSNLADLLTTEVQAERAPKTRLIEARRYAEQALHIKEQLGGSAELQTTIGILTRIAELEG
jgi:tetratricopeptide (TPR) repeat protein